MVYLSALKNQSNQKREDVSLAIIKVLDCLFYSIMAIVFTTPVVFGVWLYITRKNQINFYIQYQFKMGSNAWVMYLLFGLLYFSSAIILSVVDRPVKA